MRRRWRSTTRWVWRKEGESVTERIRRRLEEQSSNLLVRELRRPLWQGMVSYQGGDDGRHGDGERETGQKSNIV